MVRALRLLHPTMLIESFQCCCQLHMTTARKILLAVAALLIACAFLWVKGAGIENVTTIHLPDLIGLGMEMRIVVTIFEDWLRAALVTAPFAFVIALIYKRAWLWISIGVGLLQSALSWRQYSCEHLRWAADCFQIHFREVFLLPLLTWLFIKVARYIHSLNARIK